jgi:hypothetical protein
MLLGQRLVFSSSVVPLLNNQDYRASTTMHNKYALTGLTKNFPYFYAFGTVFDRRGFLEDDAVVAVLVGFVSCFWSFFSR